MAEATNSAWSLPVAPLNTQDAARDIKGGQGCRGVLISRGYRAGQVPKAVGFLFCEPDRSVNLADAPIQFTDEELYRLQNPTRAAAGD